MVGELVESLRTDGATAATESGHWGREVIGTVPGAVHRFIGVDGPRWMVRCVASAPPESADDLTLVARAVLSETVVRRGSDPFLRGSRSPSSSAGARRAGGRAQQQMADQGLSPRTAWWDPDVQQVEALEPTAVEDADPEGALGQLARAQVVAEDGAPVADLAPVDDETDDAQVPQGKRRSSGSALQRLRRRQGR